MFRELLNKGKCLVGLHDGEWSFVKEKDCTRVRVCTRCGAESRKVEHELGEWKYVRKNKCDQKQTCKRCDLTNEREVHEWQEPTFRSEDECEQVKICSRCKTEEEAPAVHLWGEWDYVSSDSCRQTQTCERCGVTGGAARNEHTYGEWQHSEQHGGAVHVCKRCGHLEVSTQTQLMGLASALGKSQQSAPPPKPPRPSSPPPAVDAKRAVMWAALKKKMDEVGKMQGAMSDVLDNLNVQAEEALESGAAVETDTEVERDPRLVAHWRFTDPTPFGVTDYHRVLQADGRFEDTSHYAGQLGEKWEGPENGTWQTSEQTLYLTYNDGRTITYEYAFDGTNTLFFPNARFQRLWQRVG